MMPSEIEAMCRRANERVYGGEKRGPRELVDAMRVLGHDDPIKVATLILDAWDRRTKADLAWVSAMVDAGIVARWSGQ